ncbi:MAG: Tic22 family protein [Spirulinaceae cyanobacterium]
MEFLTNKSTALSLISGVFLSSIFAFNQQALAISEEEIVEKLRVVVVFAIVNEQGSPLVTLVDNTSREKPVFVSQNDAQSFINQRQALGKSELVERLQVRAVSLADIYQLTKEDTQKSNSSVFSVTPSLAAASAAERTAAEAVTKSGKFQGVPLFFVSIKRWDDLQITYLERKEQDTSVIPLFFEKKAAEEMVAEFRREHPDLTLQLEIGVTSLDLILNRFETEDSETVRKMILEPTEESLEFLRSL